MRTNVNDFVIEVKELDYYDLLSVTFASGKQLLGDGLEITKNWLRMSKEEFIERYGYYFIPSERLQNKARNEIKRFCL